MITKKNRYNKEQWTDLIDSKLEYFRKTSYEHITIETKERILNFCAWLFDIYPQIQQVPHFCLSYNKRLNKDLILAVWTRDEEMKEIRKIVNSDPTLSFNYSYCIITFEIEENNILDNEEIDVKYVIDFDSFIRTGSSYKKEELVNILKDLHEFEGVE